MSNEENKESVIASYELTAAHKEDDDISESEVNDMINEIECITVALASKIEFIGFSISIATAGSPIQPSASELIVIPSCVALR